jgi:hypothetical protein
VFFVAIFSKIFCVSHQPERKEKDCLNCGTIVHGRYCQQCGQENILPHQNFWSLTKHFIYDILHFDGKFFETLKHLLFHPGYVAKQYVKGKRISYLDPVRMYLFTSAIFFLIFFAVNQIDFKIDNNAGDIRLTRPQRFEYASVVNRQAAYGNDSLSERKLNLLLDTTYVIDLQVDSSKTVTDTTFPVMYKGSKYLMVARKIAPQNQDFSGKSWIDRKMNEKWRAYKAKYGDDEKLFMADLLDVFMHRLPYVLFLSLPFFALILKLLYVRRKAFFYSDHAVFTLYHYIFSFILLLIYFLIAALQDWTGFGIFNFIAGLLLLSGGIHLFIGMKRFYGQGIIKTLGKFILLNILGLIIISLLMLGLIIFSAVQL